MSLVMTIKRNELFFLNGAIVRNGDQPATLMFENTVRFMRETDVIRESEADTPLKKLYLTLSMIYLDENRDASIELFYRQSTEIVKGDPAMAAVILDLRDLIDSQGYYRALKACRAAISAQASPI